MRTKILGAAVVVLLLVLVFTAIDQAAVPPPVSYTHLTLPTISPV
mgnify:CR=1 FL=1